MASLANTPLAPEIPDEGQDIPIAQAVDVKTANKHKKNKKSRIVWKNVTD